MTRPLRGVANLLCLLVGFALVAGAAKRQTLVEVRGQSFVAQAPRAADPESTRDAAGTVTQTVCHGRQIEMDVATPDGAMHFRAARGEFRLMLPPRLASAFDVCSQLKGQRVAIRYTKGGEGEDARLLALRVFPPGAASRSGGSTMQASSERRARPDLAPTTTATAEGKVTQVTCTGNEMLLKIATGNAEITLHARVYSRVTYDQDVGFDTKEFQACTQLKDRNASITYTAVAGRPYSGEIQSVEVEQ
jgi:hypothetical protein